MTKVTKETVKCIVCGIESEQFKVYSVNYSLGSIEDNKDLQKRQQKCPNCGYENFNISKEKNK